MRTWLLKIWTAITAWIESVLSRYLYVVPAIMGTALVCIVIFVIYTMSEAVDDMHKSVESIPKIIQIEMEKTRQTLVQEGSSNREAIVGQHQATREELQRKMDELEEERIATTAALAKLQKSQAEVKKKIDEKPKRQKVLGIF
jgi:flagellar motility protein MotE (MotC chaperone)